MNQFKEGLHRELKSITLSKEKQQAIVRKARGKSKHQTPKSNWQYRIVLATFTIFLVGFSYVLMQKSDTAVKSTVVNTSASGTKAEDIWVVQWLQNDFVKAILVLLFYIIARVIAKKILVRKSNLPTCIHCGEEWTYKETFKLIMRGNQAIVCPYCEGKQYRTKKSTKRFGILNLIFPFMIFIPMIFDYYVVGLIVHMMGIFYFTFSLSPYFVETQEDDPINEPLW